jgi:hypothetical protein
MVFGRLDPPLASGGKPNDFGQLGTLPASREAEPGTPPKEACGPGSARQVSCLAPSTWPSGSFLGDALTHCALGCSVRPSAAVDLLGIRRIPPAAGFCVPGGPRRLPRSSAAGWSAKVWQRRQDSMCVSIAAGSTAAEPSNYVAQRDVESPDLHGDRPIGLGRRRQITASCSSRGRIYSDSGRRSAS